MNRNQRTTLDTDRILQLASRREGFGVSLRYRDEWLVTKCEKLRRAGKLVCGGRMGREYVYFTPRKDSHNVA